MGLWGGGFVPFSAVLGSVLPYFLLLGAAECTLGGGLPYFLHSDALGGADLGQFGALRSSLGSVLSRFLLL